MPIFDFKCDNCEIEFEKLIIGSGEHIITCPNCDSKNVKKMISRSSFRIEGFSEANGYAYKHRHSDADIINNDPVKSIKNVQHSLSNIKQRV